MQTRDKRALWLRPEQLQPGDILLTRGTDFESRAIIRFGGGRFSHSAVIVNQLTTYESDGGLIRHRALGDRGRAKMDGRSVQIAAPPGDVDYCAVYRHPGLAALPAGSFEEAWKKEILDSIGKSYSPLSRLVKLSTFPKWAKPLVVRLANLYEKWRKPVIAAGARIYPGWRPKLEGTTKEQFKASGISIPGEFCSELVAKIYARLGLPLFDDLVAPADVSPNALARSKKLVPVEGAVVERERLDELDFTFEYPHPNDRVDAAAQVTNLSRVYNKGMLDLVEVLKSQAKQFHVAPGVFAELHGRKLELASNLLDDAWTMGKTWLVGRAIRLATALSGYTHDVIKVETPIDEGMPDDARHQRVERDRAIIERMGDWNVSLLRCATLVKSQKLRRAARERTRIWHFLERGRLIRDRKRLLRHGRTSQQWLREMAIRSEQFREDVNATAAALLSLAPFVDAAELDGAR